MSIWDKGRTVKLCVAGTGGRGIGLMEELLDMADVEIVAVCDKFAPRAEKAADMVAAARDGRRPAVFADPHDMFETTDAEGVIIASDWFSHVPIAIDAMKHGLRPGMEVGGANDLYECWELVRTSENTGVPLMLLENCCYGEKELTLLNMIKKGLFGNVMYCAGGYEHDLRKLIGEDQEVFNYRRQSYVKRNGEVYPTHELGPIATYLNINRGNRMVSLTSSSSGAVGQQQWMRANHPDPEWYDCRFAQGDVVLTTIKCANGELISLNLQCTLPRPYSRGGVVQGTRGIWQEDNASIYIEGDSPKHEAWEPDERLMREHRHPLWKAYEEFGPRGGHGGMDYLVLRAYVESVQNGTQPPIDVYDAATWMSITCLSEQSIALGSAPVAIPDFTCGRWMEPRPQAKSCFALDAVHEDMF